MTTPTNKSPRSFDIAKSYANAIKKSYDFKVIEENRMAWASGFSHGEEEAYLAVKSRLEKCEALLRVCRPEVLDEDIENEIDKYFAEVDK
jgi:hypothetical protein